MLVENNSPKAILSLPCSARKVPRIKPMRPIVPKTMARRTSARMIIPIIMRKVAICQSGMRSNWRTQGSNWRGNSSLENEYRVPELPPEVVALPQPARIPKIHKALCFLMICQARERTAPKSILIYSFSVLKKSVTPTRLWREVYW